MEHTRHRDQIIQLPWREPYPLIILDASYHQNTFWYVAGPHVDLWIEQEFQAVRHWIRSRIWETVSVLTLNNLPIASKPDPKSRQFQSCAWLSEIVSLTVSLTSSPPCNQILLILTSAWIHVLVIASRVHLLHRTLNFQMATASWYLLMRQKCFPDTSMNVTLTWRALWNPIFVQACFPNNPTKTRTL